MATSTNRGSSFHDDSATKTAKTRKVLLIQQPGEKGQALERLFDPKVWKVSYAPDNTSALALATAEPFDLIVTSATTTGAQDVVLLRRLRMARPHTRLIILTQKKARGDVLNALRYHAFSFFSAPLATEHLRTLIENAMNEPEWDNGIELIQGTPEYVELAIRCDPKVLDRLEQFLREAVPLPKAEMDEVSYAFREIVLNAMEHGGHFDPDQSVELCYLKSKRQVMCRIKDPGPGFSLEEVEQDAQRRLLGGPEGGPIVGEGDSVPRGFGILMAQHFVDELVFGEKGNDVVMIKYLPDAEKHKNPRDNQAPIER